jgi:ABC-type transport system involved in multi-copper enzyme maturation permease subunit
VIALARAELLKLRSTRTALGLFIAILVATIVPLVLLLAFVPKSWLQEDGISEFLNTASALVPLVLLVFGILGMTNEYRHGTITYSYLVTPRRWQVMVVKLAVYAAVGIVTMLVAVVLVYLVILVGGEIRGVGIDATGGSTLGDYARTIVVAGLITTFGVALGALFRAQVITVAGALIWALFVENIIVVLKPKIGMWMPFTVFNNVSAAQIPGDSADVAGMTIEQFSRPTAFLVSLVYIALVSLLAVFISLRRDVS